MIIMDLKYERSQGNKCKMSDKNHFWAAKFQSNWKSTLNRKHLYPEDCLLLYCELLAHTFIRDVGYLFSVGNINSRSVYSADWQPWYCLLQGGGGGKGFHFS